MKQTVLLKNRSFLFNKHNKYIHGNLKLKLIQLFFTLQWRHKLQETHLTLSYSKPDFSPIHKYIYSYANTIVIRKGLNVCKHKI